MKLEIRSGLCQALRHAQQRRYADAAREQERTACIDQREVIARRTDLHQVALPYDVVHGARAAPRLRVPKDRNTIVAALYVLRSEERSVGKGGCSPCTTRWSP